MCEMEVVVKKRQSIVLTVDEGWYSEREMSEELKWSSSLAMA